MTPTTYRAVLDVYDGDVLLYRIGQAVPREAVRRLAARARCGDRNAFAALECVRPEGAAAPRPVGA